MPPDADGQQTNGFGQAVSEVSERATLIIREEIELAKAEISEKVSSLVKGAVVGIVAGIFVVIGLLFLLGAVAGFLALRWLRSGAPPTPDMAIDEAQRIRATLTGEPGGQLEAVAARAEAGLAAEEVRAPGAGES